MHVHSATGDPVADVSVEGIRREECSTERCDATSIPAANVSIENIRVPEEFTHIHNITGVPVANVLVKSIRLVEHLMHGRNATRIPAADVLVEGRRTGEERAHIRDTCTRGKESQADDSRLLRRGETARSDMIFSFARLRLLFVIDRSSTTKRSPRVMVIADTHVKRRTTTYLL